MERKMCRRCGKMNCECPINDIKNLEQQLKDVVEDPNLPDIKVRLRKRKMFRKIFK